MKEKTKSITIIGRRWFDKINGNSYCTAKVLINGKLSFNLPYEYGYGEMYLQLCWHTLIKNNLLNPPAEVYMTKNYGKSYEDFWHYGERTKVRCFATVSDVARKKDL